MKPPEKYVRTKSDEEKINQGHVWDQDAGDRVCRFLEKFLVMENGKKFQPLDYQRDFINSTYCWKRPDGRRSTKISFLTLGRKNGKTAIGWGLSAYHLLADNAVKPSCISCAVNKEQASQIFEGINWSRQHNPKLIEVLHPVPSRKEIHYPAKGGVYKSASSEAAGKFGTGHDFVLYDELAFHLNDKLYTALQNSGDSKPNSLQMVISTAGWNKNGVFYRLYRYAKSVLDGSIIDTTFNPWVFETPDDADLDDPKTHLLANPGMGITLDPTEFSNQWTRAKRDVASKLDFLRLKFNSWTEAETVWIPVEKWDSCRGNFPNLEGQPCYLGLDAGSTQDLTALVAVFPIQGRYYVKSWGLAPEAAAQKRDAQNLVPYQRFTLDNSLQIIPGECVGIEQDLYPLIDHLRRSYNVKSLTVDKWQTLQLSQHYMAQGMTVNQIPQHATKLNDPCKTLERLINDGRLVHDGNALLRWQIGHVVLDRNANGYVKPGKTNESQKIDNVVALVMAISQAVQHDLPDPNAISTGVVWI